MVAQIFALVPKVTDMIALGLNRIEVWKSLGAENLYEEITDQSPTSASIMSAAARNTFRAGGCLLKVSVDGAPAVDISFGAAVKWWTPQQVANRVNEVSPGVASVAGKSVVLSSPTVGRSSSISVPYCDILDFGIPAGSSSRGKDSRLPLDPSVMIYEFTDVSGSPDDTYKWRMSNGGYEPVTAFSHKIPGDNPPLEPSMVSLATCTFLGSDGRAKKTRIIVVTDYSPSSLGGYVVGTDPPVIVESDDHGFLVAPMVRGMKVRVAIEGTPMVREFVVPDVDKFDLLSVMGTAPDPFTVQVPPAFLIRRSI